MVDSDVENLCPDHNDPGYQARIMAFDNPAAGIGGHLLRRYDLTDRDVVKDFAFQLRRCATNEDYAKWAKAWGEVAAVQLLDDSLIGNLDDNEIHQKLSQGFDDLAKAANRAVKALWKLAEGDLSASTKSPMNSITP